MKLRIEFVETIPEKIEESILYVSMEFGTAIHLCPCGCKERVVTPFSPLGWKLSYDGEGVSLTPSIGNWSSKCKTHYWIINSEIRMAERWHKVDKRKVRKLDKSDTVRNLTKAKNNNRKLK